MLTATVVHLDTVVRSTSRAKILQYIVTVPQINTAMNVTFPEGEAPWKMEPSRCRDKYTLALSRVAVGIECQMAAWGSGEDGAADRSLQELHDPGG